MPSLRVVRRALLPLVAFAPLGAQARVEPELVSLPEVAAGKNKTFPFVDPADGSLWFSAYADNFDRQTIMRAPKKGSGWDTPVSVAFSNGQSGDRAPRFSPDGKRLYFSSNRATTAGGQPGLFHLWVVERSGTTWGEPKLLPEPVNSAAADRHSSQTAAGDLYFSSTRPGGAGRSDIYVVKPQGRAAELLPAPVSDPLGQTDLLVSPDGRWMVLVVTGHPQGLGGDDLFLLRREGNGWSAPKRLPEGINSSEYEYGPSLSPDGKTFYFNSHRRGGTSDIYRVPIGALGINP